MQEQEQGLDRRQFLFWLGWGAASLIGIGGGFLALSERFETPAGQSLKQLEEERNGIVREINQNPQARQPVEQLTELEAQITAVRAIVDREPLTILGLGLGFGGLISAFTEAIVYSGLSGLKSTENRTESPNNRDKVLDVPYVIVEKQNNTN